MAVTKIEKPTALVKHKPSVRDAVARYIVGTSFNIGSFYDEAALDKLKKLTKKAKNEKT